MSKTKELLEQAKAETAHGVGVSLEDTLIAALVAAPFVGALAILVHQATGLPTLIMTILWLVVQVVSTLWVAGRRRRAESD